VVISASRRPEKLLDAPASVSVVDGDAVARRPMLTPSDHLRGLPAVDIGTKGITQSNVAVRGFNDIISGNLRLLTDYRFTQIPSIRYSVPHLLSLANEDVERVEVVSGPGSALYGPNSAHGVVHFLTRSPFDAPGTQVSVGGGNRNVLTSTARHGDRLSDRVAYRVSLQYLRGDDWKSLDPAEPDSVVLYRVTSAGTVPQGELRSNARDFDTEKVSGEAVVAVRPDAETSLHLTAGWGRYDAVELVTNGAVQSRGFANGYGQVRLQRGSLFAQTFVNAIDAGDSYLLRTGQLVDDTSRLYGGQLQHSYSHGEDRQLTYGLDALLTRPDTRHSLHGSNEDRDSVDELGTAPDLRARCGGRRGPRRPDRGAGVRPISDCT
jgi:iron complex outermembrane receptor protein